MSFYWLVLMLGAPFLVQAAEDKADPYHQYQNTIHYDESLETPWIETEVTVESLPKDDDLTLLSMDKMPPNMRLYADWKNLKLDKEDRVTRLWLVARSQQGAYNGTYEGFRCATGEYKIYAYANINRMPPLRTVQLPDWRNVRMGSYRHELMKDYLCDNADY